MSNYAKWEYKVENELYLTEEKLTQLGAEGWELVAIYGGKAYFKRIEPIVLTLSPQTEKQLKESFEQLNRDRIKSMQTFVHHARIDLVSGRFACCIIDPETGELTGHERYIFPAID